ncbi:hypothetical protein [Labilibaculum manganireducens]|uniref:hypothetical protein n=1 Tax=Labilibaculum manganireducens TaxID=1940525 RepID=UPI0029F4CB6B|nr:hypothetical protein [Labilibaculum manganireducens]
MITELDIVLSPKDASDKKYYLPILAKKLGVNVSQIHGIKILRKSIDARRRNILVNLRFRVACGEEFLNPKNLHSIILMLQVKRK